jgi:hypothetical protein
MDEPHLPLVTSSMERLTLLIENAEPILQASLPAVGLPAIDLPGAALPGQPSESLLHLAPQPEPEEHKDRT